MAFHTKQTFAEIIQALPPEGRDLSEAEIDRLWSSIEDALDLYFEPLPKTEFRDAFDTWVEIKQPRNKKGGRPKDTSKDTLVLALADIAAKTIGEPVEELPVAASSWFAGFLNACLRPISLEKDLTVALAGRWEDLRAVMRGET